jgi:hypothetical protein
MMASAAAAPARSIKARLAVPLATAAASAARISETVRMSRALMT